MRYYFYLVGDEAPNSDKEIFLEPQKKKDIYEEFKSDYPHNLASESGFLNIWLECFPNVKIREWKAVMFKCDVSYFC